MSYVFTSDGYSWGAMSEAINAMWPYNSADYTGLSAVNAYYAGNLVTNPPPGVVKVTANFKAQYMKFWANEDGVKPGTEGAVPLNRYIVIDEWGNKYIMHASGQSDPDAVAQAFEDAVLPEGWTKKVKQLSHDKIFRRRRVRTARTTTSSSATAPTTATTRSTGRTKARSQHRSTACRSGAARPMTR